MGILQIKPVTISGLKFINCFYGMSETGKTLSALRVAAGLEPDPNKRLLIDTEGGQRGRAYFNRITGGYLYAAFDPPHSPERYIQAIDEAEQAGVTVAVIDSGSHVWFGKGGVLDMAEDSTVKNDLGKWIIPKRKLQKFVRRMISSDMHIFICARAKQLLIKDETGKLIPGEVVPIQDKALRFDMTIVAHMLGDGRFNVAAPAGKCPGILRPIFENSPVMDEQTGRKMREWIGNEAAKSPAMRSLERKAEIAAESGTASFQSFLKLASHEEREHLRLQRDNYLSKAAAADEEAREREKEAKSEPPDDPFAGPSDTPMTIAHVGNPLPVLLPGIHTLIDEVNAITDVKQLLAWWNSDQTGSSVQYLEATDHDGWEKVCDAYETRREALASIDRKAS